MIVCVAKSYHLFSYSLSEINWSFEKHKSLAEVKTSDVYDLSIILSHSQILSIYLFRFLSHSMCLSLFIIPVVPMHQLHHSQTLRQCLILWVGMVQIWLEWGDRVLNVWKCMKVTNICKNWIPCFVEQDSYGSEFMKARNLRWGMFDARRKSFTKIYVGHCYHCKDSN